MEHNRTCSSILDIWTSMLDSHTCSFVAITLQIFLTPQYLAIAMEFVAGGDMFEFVVSKKGLKESEAR